MQLRGSPITNGCLLSIARARYGQLIAAILIILIRFDLVNRTEGFIIGVNLHSLNNLNYWNLSKKMGRIRKDREIAFDLTFM